ncbi:MAG TPA: hypothetical protein VIN38_11950 [Thiobacillus sp.]
MAMPFASRLYSTLSTFSMHQILISIAVSVLFSSAVLAGSVSAQCPGFDQFRVKEVFNGPYAKPDINSSLTGKRFRTVIQNAYVREPDFAGHYRVISWGCGSNCHVFVLVDMKTGQLIHAPGPASLDAEYHVDSALFVIDPQDRIQESGSDMYQTKYFVWGKVKGAFLPLKGCGNSAQQNVSGDVPTARRP